MLALADESRLTDAEKQERDEQFSAEHLRVARYGAFAHEYHWTKEMVDAQPSAYLDDMWSFRTASGMAQAMIYDRPNPNGDDGPPGSLAQQVRELKEHGYVPDDTPLEEVVAEFGLVPL